MNNNSEKVINEFSRLSGKKLNLHLGCGKKLFPDYINIDLYNISEGREIKPDLNLDITKLHEYVDEGTIEKILIVHVVEHFNRWETINLLKSFHTCLKTGGLLEIEMPDLDGCINFYVKNRGKNYKAPIGEINCGLVQFYGNQWSGNSWETHKYVWRKSEIKNVLETIGFKIIQLNNAAKYHIKERDMYIVAQKRA